MKIDPILSSSKQISKIASQSRSLAKEVVANLQLGGSIDFSTFFATIEERLAAVNVHLKRTDLGAAGTIEAVIDNDQIKYKIPFLKGVYDDINEAFEDLAQYRVASAESVSRTRSLLAQEGYVSNLTNPYGGVAEIEQNINKKIQAILNASDTGDESMRKLKSLLQTISEPIDSSAGPKKVGYDFSNGIQIRILGFGDELVLDKNGNFVPVNLASKQSIPNDIERARKLARNNPLAGSLLLDDKTRKIVQITAGGETLDTYTTNLLLAMVNDEILDPEAMQKALASGDSAKVMKMLQKMIKRGKGIISDRPISLAGDDLIEYLSSGSDELAKAIRAASTREEKLELIQQKIYIGDRKLSLMEKFAFGETYDYNVELAGRGGLFEQYGKMFNPYATAEILQDVNPDDFFGRILEAYQEGVIGQPLEGGINEHIRNLRAQEVQRLKDAIIEHNRLLKQGYFGNEMHRAGGKSLEDFLSGKVKISKQEYRKLSSQSRKLYVKDGEEYVAKQFDSNLVENLFLSVETASDGSTIGNSSFMRRAAKTSHADYIRQNYPIFDDEYSPLGKYITMAEEIDSLINSDANAEDAISQFQKELEFDIEQYSKATTPEARQYLTELNSLSKDLQTGQNLSMIDRQLARLQAVEDGLGADKKTLAMMGEIAEERARLEAQRNLFLKGATHNQVTARGNHPLFANVKSIFRFIPLEGEQTSQYAFFFDEFDFKPELGFGRDTFIVNLSGIGGHREQVAVDQLMTIFHGSIYENNESRLLREMEKKRIFAEIEEIFKTGKIPEKLLQGIDEQASITDVEISMLEASKRPGAIKNRMIAKEVQLAIMTTPNPSMHPTVINEIFRSYEKELYVVDAANRNLSPVDTMLKRMTLNTELQALAGESNLRKPFLGRGTTRINGITVTDMAAETLKQRGIDSVSQSLNIFNIDHDMFKFRSVEHGILFGGDAVGIYRHALGGMDLDDKGLPKIATYIDKDGIRKFMMPLVRQPSSMEEVVYGIPAIDAETIRDMFHYDVEGVFSKHLDALIEQSADIDMMQTMAGGGNPRYAAAYRRLRDILQMDDSGLKNFLKSVPGELENSEEIVQAIIDVYESMEKAGVTAITDISSSPDILEKIIKYGSSPLAVKDLASEPQYSTRGVFKIFEEAGAFDFRSPLRDVLNASTDPDAAQRLNMLPDKIRTEILKVLNDNTLDVKTANETILKTLSQDYANEPTVRELISSVFERMQLNKLAVEEGVENVSRRGVGGAVNILAVLGGTRPWFEETLRNLPEDQARFILENYQVGQLTSEAFIDLNIGFAGERSIIEGAYQAILEAAQYGDDAQNIGIAKALQELFLGPEAKKTFNVDEIASIILERMGKQMGATIAFLDDEEKMKFIDKEILSYRLMGEDADFFRTSIRVGIEDIFDKQIELVQNNINILQEEIQKTPKRHTRIIAKKQQEIAQLEEKINILKQRLEQHPIYTKINDIDFKALEHPVVVRGRKDLFATSKRALEETVNTVGFGPENEFAYLGGQQKQLKETYAQMQAMKRTRLSAAYKLRNETTGYFIGETEQNISKAQNIIGKIFDQSTVEQLRNIFNVDSMVRQAMTTPEQFNFDLISESVARNIYEKLMIGAQSEGMTAEIVINAAEEFLATAFLDKEGNRITQRMPDLMGIAPHLQEVGPRDKLMEKVLKQIEITRRLRDVKKSLSPAQFQANKYAQELMQKMQQLKGASSIQEMKERAKYMLETGHYQMTKEGQLIIAELENQDKIILRALLGEIPMGELSETEFETARSVAEAMVVRHSLDNELQQYADVVDEIRTRGAATNAEELREGYERIYSELIGEADQAKASGAYASQSIPTRIQQIADEMITATETVGQEVADTVKPTYKRLNMEGLSDLWSNNKLFKGTAILTATAIAGSVAYKYYKGRSNDDMKGPALLPGGSAYEPMPVNDRLDLNYSAPQYKPGLSYDVSVQGPQDKINQFNQEVQGLSNAPVDTTIYNRIPSMTDDPYSKMASLY